MTKRKRTFWKAFITPILFGTYPLISLIAKNALEVHISDGYRALIYCLVGTTFLTLLFLWVYRDWQKASLVSSITLLFFFSYGHILFAIQQISPKIGNHFYSIGATLVILGLLIWVVKISKRDLGPIINTLTLVGIVAITLPTYQIISNGWNTARFRREYISPEISMLSLDDIKIQSAPDIYYIILDAYGRDDSLQTLLDFDNSEFLGTIKDMGFYVARCSRSNYSRTRMSLSSSLNLHYLQDIIDLSASEDEITIALGHIIENNLVREHLEEAGYQTYAFETGFVWTQIENSDFYLSLSNTIPKINTFNQTQNKLESLVLQTSIISSISAFQDFIPAYLVPNLYQHEILQREQILFIFDQLDKIPHKPGKKFVFAHIVSPHYPFVFTEDGSIPDDTSNEAIAYSEQLFYINTRVIEIIEKIITASDEQPIIILQSDHGPQVEDQLEQMKIFNAYYLPNFDMEYLPQDISPVNTFRIILNSYFGAKYPLLENISYFSSTDSPYDFTVLFDDRPGCSPDIPSE